MENCARNWLKMLAISSMFALSLLLYDKEKHTLELGDGGVSAQELQKQKIMLSGKNVHPLEGTALNLR